MSVSDQLQARLAERMGRRRVLLGALGTAGLLAAPAGLGGLLNPPRARAAELSRDTLYRATAFREGGRLVAVVLDPVDDGYDPFVFRGDGIATEDLGTGTLDRFKKLLSGMTRSRLADGNAVRAVVYSLRTSGRDYARIFSDTRNHYVTIANPRRSDFDGGGCFTAGTRVLMADGGLKPIAEVAIGEKVSSFDFAVQRRTAGEVTSLHRLRAPSYLLINGLEVTPTHPFAVGEDAWLEAGDLRVGDRVLGDGAIAIDSIERVQRGADVFNMTVGGPHNFYVSGVKKRFWSTTRAAAADSFGQGLFLVHNKGAGLCLLEDSLVLDGERNPRRICEVGRGEAVLCLDLSRGQITATRVTEVLKNHLREAYYTVNGELCITNDHPLLATDAGKTEWTRTESLAVGDRIRTASGTVRVETIERIDQEVPTVYLATSARNFLVAGGKHLYVVHGDYKDAGHRRAEERFAAGRLLCGENGRLSARPVFPLFPVSVVAACSGPPNARPPAAPARGLGQSLRSRSALFGPVQRAWSSATARSKSGHP